MKIIDNSVIVYYNFRKVLSLGVYGEESKYEDFGKTEIHLNYNNGYLTIKKIKYHEIGQ